MSVRAIQGIALIPKMPKKAGSPGMVPVRIPFPTSDRPGIQCYLLAFHDLEQVIPSLSVSVALSAEKKGQADNCTGLLRK